jgi:DNA repair ATPase RecN
VRLFDCSFIERHGCAVLIGPTGTGKSHLLTAFGYTAAERGGFRLVGTGYKLIVFFPKPGSLPVFTFGKLHDIA